MPQPNLYDYLASPESFMFVASGDRQNRMNQEGRANMTRTLQEYVDQRPPHLRARVGLPQMSEWYSPGTHPLISYTHDMPPGYHGQYWKVTPDVVDIRPGPEQGFEELYGGFDPVSTFIHENTHRTQTAKRTGNYYEIDNRYFPTVGGTKKFIDQMLDMLNIDQELFKSNYKTLPEQMDEVRARLMAADAIRSRDNPIWRDLDPTAISWFLESTRSGWNPRKSDKEIKSQVTAGGRNTKGSK